MDDWIIDHIDRLEKTRRSDLAYAVRAKFESRTEDYERSMRSIWYIDQEIMKLRK